MLKEQKELSNYSIGGLIQRFDGLSKLALILAMGINFLIAIGSLATSVLAIIFIFENGVLTTLRYLAILSLSGLYAWGMCIVFYKVNQKLF